MKKSKTTLSLDVYERVQLADIVSQFGYQRAFIQVAEDFLKTVSFTEKEMKHYEMKHAKNGTAFNPNKNKSISFEIPDFIIENVMKHYDRKLDSKEGLLLQAKPLYDKFLKLQPKEKK